MIGIHVLACVRPPGQKPGPVKALFFDMSELAELAPKGDRRPIPNLKNRQEHL